MSWNVMEKNMDNTSKDEETQHDDQLTCDDNLMIHDVEGSRESVGRCGQVSVGPCFSGHNWRFTEEPHFEEPHLFFILLEGSDLDAQEGTHVQKMYFSQTERR